MTTALEQAGRAAGRWPAPILAVASPQHPAVPRDELLRSGVDLCPYSDGLSALLGIGHDLPAAVIAPTDMTGVPLMQFTEAVTAWARIPVLVALGNEPNAADTAYSALEHGARALLPLPYLARDVLVALQNAGVRHHHRTLAPPPSTALELDPVAVRIRVHGAEIRCNVRQFQILAALQEAEGRVMPLTELAAAVGATRETAKSMLIRLRARVRQVDPEVADRIQTVSGSGYRLANR